MATSISVMPAGPKQNMEAENWQNLTRSELIAVISTISIGVGMGIFAGAQKDGAGRYTALFFFVGQDGAVPRL